MPPPRRRPRLLSNLVLCAGFVSLLIGANRLVASASQPDEHAIAICQATGSTAAPYVESDVNIAALQDPAHSGRFAKDIIPPFTYEGFSYPGRNWTDPFLAIWNNGCQVAQTTSRLPARSPSTLTAGVISVEAPLNTQREALGAFLVLLGLLTMIWAGLGRRS